MRKPKFIMGNILALIFWIADALIMPLLPDIIRKVILKMDITIVLPQNYILQSFYWGILLMVVWIRTSKKAYTIYEKQGAMKSILFLLFVFTITILIFGVVMRVLIH